MININTINIPTSWDDVSYREYARVNHIVETFKDEDDAVTLKQNIFLLSVLTNKDITVFDDWEVKDLLRAFKSLDFMVVSPQDNKGYYKWNIPKAKNLTTDKWLSFHNLRTKLQDENQPVVNTTVEILSLLSDVPQEEIWNMATPEVLHGFFMLKRISTLSTISSLKSLYLKYLRKNYREIPGTLWLLLKLMVKHLISRLSQLLKKKRP